MSSEYFLTTSKKIMGRDVIGIKLEVNANGDATMTLENDSGTYGKRYFKSTGFPSEGIYLFAYPYDRKWIIMLLSEY